MPRAGLTTWKCCRDGSLRRPQGRLFGLSKLRRLGARLARPQCLVGLEIVMLRAGKPSIVAGQFASLLAPQPKRSLLRQHPSSLRTDGFFAGVGWQRELRRPPAQNDSVSLAENDKIQSKGALSELSPPFLLKRRRAVGGCVEFLASPSERRERCLGSSDGRT